jgi:hypothetical protein
VRARGIVDAVADYRHDATLSPEALDDVALSEGSTSVSTSSMPTCAATARVVWLSPVSSTARRPSALSDATRPRGLLGGVGDDEYAADLAVPRGHDGGAAVGVGGPPGGVELGGNVEAPLGHQRRAANMPAMAIDDALEPEPLNGW